MPTYEFKCRECAHEFELFLTMSKYKQPTKCPCPSCGKKKTVDLCVSQNATEVLMEAPKKPNSGFREVISKIKENNPLHTIKDY